jgi:hypothetical protein
MPPFAGGRRSGPHILRLRVATSPSHSRPAADPVGRLRDLLDELHAREAAERLADDALAEGAWDDEGGAAVAQRALDDSASRSAPSTSSGTTDSF